MDPEELPEMIRRAQGGDAEARNEIFALYFRRVHDRMSGKIDRRLRSKLDTMELVQTGMREAIVDLDRYVYQGTGSFYRWLCRIVEHKLYGKQVFWSSRRRDVRRERPLPAVSSDATSPQARAVPLEASDTRPPERAARSEEERVVREEIDRLEEPFRSILRLHQKGFTDARIGEQLGESPNTIRWNRIRGMKRLAPRLRKRLGQEPRE